MDSPTLPAQSSVGKSEPTEVLLLLLDYQEVYWRFLT